MADLLENAAADLAAAAENQRMRVAMPSFDNAKEDAMLAQDFFERFSGWCTMARYADAQKATALRYALSGSALVWWNSENRSTNVNMEVWADVQVAFEARFYKEPTPRYIDEELGKIHQKPKESVRTYLDRVKGAINLLDRLWPIPVANNAAQRQAKQVSNQLVHDKLVLQFFLRHLRPDIKTGMTQAQNMITLQDHVQAAIRAEELLAEMKPPAHNNNQAPIHTTDSAEVATAETNKKKKKKKQAANSGGQQTPLSAVGTGSTLPPSNTQRLNPLNPSSVPPGNYKCHICQIPGHYIQFCPNKQRRPEGQQVQRPLQAMSVQPVVQQPGVLYYTQEQQQHMQQQHMMQLQQQQQQQFPPLSSTPSQYQAHPGQQPGLDLNELSIHSRQPF